MAESALIDEVESFVRKYWEVPKEPLDAATDLVARFNRLDPAEFVLFLEAVSQTFSIRTPGKTQIDRLTIADLCTCIEAGEWPKYLP